MQARAPAQALVQGTSLDGRGRGYQLQGQDRTIFSSSILFGWQGLAFSESYMSTTSELLASGEILMLAGKMWS
jgi:hypothetical protein